MLFSLRCLRYLKLLIFSGPKKRGVFNKGMKSKKLASGAAQQLRHRLDMNIKKFKQLLADTSKLKERIDSHDLDILDRETNKEWKKIEFPPKSAWLRMSDVRLLTSGKLKELYVIEPQDYDKVVKMTKKNYMLKDDTCLFYEYGPYAVSGTGGDEWLLANNYTVKYLENQYKYLKKVLEIQCSG